MSGSGRISLKPCALLFSFSTVACNGDTMQLTPANQRSQTPSQGVKPDHENGQGGSSLGAPVYGLQRLGDNQIAVNRDGQ